VYNLIEAISSWTEQKLRSILKNVLLIVLCPFVLFWFTDSDCPFGIFKLLLLIVLCPSVLFLIYGFWLPLWYLQTLIVDRSLSFCPFFDLRILISPLVSSNFYCRSLFVVLSFSLLVIALSVVQITVSDYPFGTFTLFFYRIDGT
jgi:hypothetical protein